LSDDRHTTKEKLLDAAERLFAEKGFEGASIRDLAAAADVNIAAVNYHFQGKDNLYSEVIMRRFVGQRDATLAALETLREETGGQPALDRIIETLVGQHVTGALAIPGHSTFMALMGREMNAERSIENATFFKQLIAPIFEAFSSALLKACPDLGREQMNWVVASIVGQVHHFIFRRHKWDSLPEGSEPREFMQRAFPALSLSRDDYVREVTRHVTRFSTAAIEGLRGEVTP
jgi:AcrR family transcriptional regulator